MRIIYKYILHSILPSFLANILVLSSILLMARFMDMANLVLSKGVSPLLVLKILFLALPKVLSMTIPMASLLAVLTTFLRMSADSELTVLRASGLSIYQFLPPVILFALFAAIANLIFMVGIGPQANYNFRSNLLSLAKKRADLAIKEQVFVRDFPGLVIYVGKIAVDSDRLEQVFIYDHRSLDEESSIIARSGHLSMNEKEGVLMFYLEDGVVDRYYKQRPETDSIFFKTYELKLAAALNSDDAEDNVYRGRSELSSAELLEQVDILKSENNTRKANIMLMEWHRRLAFPLATFLMALIALPLGASFKVRGRNFALIMGAGVFILYYSLFSAGWSMGESELVKPFIAVWSSDFFLLIISLWLLRRVDNHKSSNIIKWLKKIKRV